MTLSENEMDLLDDYHAEDEPLILCDICQEEYPSEYVVAGRRVCSDDCALKSAEKYNK